MFSRRPLLLLLSGLAIAIGLTGCPKSHHNAWPEKAGPKVLTSFAPVQCMVLNVVGDDGNVISILSNKGPHDDGEVTPHHLKLASQADVLFINGMGLDEKLAGKIRQASGKPDLPLVELAEEIDKKWLIEGECHHEAGHQHGEEHEHGFDMHVWLSPKLARFMVAAVAEEMKKLDPAHGANYESRASAYMKKLEVLERDGLAMLKDKQERKIVSFHDSLRYFGQCFGVEIAGHIQMAPGVEPSLDHMKQLIELCKKEKIRVIAVEPQYPRSTSAKTMLDELKKHGIDAEFVEIDPLETCGEGLLNADLYETVMRANLDHLAKALR